MSRDDAWETVWNERDEVKTDWNGCEACFPSLAAYEQWVARAAEFVCEELQLGPADAVVDLGCGTGRYTNHIAPRVASVIGVDYSEPALAIARRDRQAGNVTYEWADLNSADASRFAGCNKAYAVGSMFYLTSVERVLDLAEGLARQGTEVLMVDLPDADLGDARPRDYDRETYSHLHFRESDFSDRFPGSRFVRGQFPEYVNDAVRFSVVIPPMA
jgi:cyclopropane fatty-acyl-phospholipid synthase-like methyltransferase